MKITLKIIQGGNEISQKIYGEGVIRLGRSEISDIVLSHESISRSQIEIRVNESNVYMTNMGVAGRVTMLGRPVETAEMNDGDELAVGPYRIVVQFGERLEEGAMADAPIGEAPPAVEEDGGGGIDLPDEPLSEEPQIEPNLDLQEVSVAAPKLQTEVEFKPVVAKMLFLEGPRKGSEVKLDSYEVVLGRSKNADIYLDDKKLSRQHAKIVRVGQGYRLIDLNSRNGTEVNGVRVLEHPLSSFDEIVLGKTKIKFLIHDALFGKLEGREGGKLIPMQIEQTRSVQFPSGMGVSEGTQVAAAQRAEAPESMLKRPVAYYQELPKAKRNRIIVGVLIMLAIALVFIPTEETKKPEPKPTTTALPSNMPKEYGEFSPETQRAVEGFYNSAKELGDRGNYEEAVSNLRRIHEVLPFYKQSKELLTLYNKKLKEKQIAEAQDKAKKAEKQDLGLALEEGIEYLKEGDFERAAESFNLAITLDPKNQTAIQGMRAAELKVRRIEDLPPERDPEAEKRQLVAELLTKGLESLKNKSYQEAIETAEKIRQIEIKGSTEYLNDAKQIIDRAKVLQKEEFEPFMIQAKEKFAEGDYNASRDLCDEMLKRDSAYEDARECSLKAKKQLNRLAKEAYTYGYILESMNRIEEAKQFWNRAKNYVRPGDDYYEKVYKKLEHYQ